MLLENRVWKIGKMYAYLYCILKIFCNINLLVYKNINLKTKLLTFNEKRVTRNGFVWVSSFMYKLTRWCIVVVGEVWMRHSFDIFWSLPQFMIHFWLPFSPITINLQVWIYFVCIFGMINTSNTICHRIMNNV